MDPFASRPASGVPSRQDDAETIALHAVAHIMGDDVLRDRFLALTGCCGGDVVQRLGDAAFLGAVLDFLLADEASLLAFAQATNLSPEAPAWARSALP